jgi:hypothetical protein
MRKHMPELVGIFLDELLTSRGFGYKWRMWVQKVVIRDGFVGSESSYKRWVYASALITKIVTTSKLGKA